MSEMHRILVADDQEDLRLLVRASLEDGDYDVIEACDGLEALAVVKAVVPALIVMDWMMPGMSGIDVIRALKANPATKDIPVILLTARSREGDRALGLEAGVSVFLPKPFSPMELVDHVERLLHS